MFCFFRWISVKGKFVEFEIIDMWRSVGFGTFTILISLSNIITVSGTISFHTVALYISAEKDGDKLKE